MDRTSHPDRWRDTARAQTVIGLFKAEGILGSEPWHTADAIEREPLKQIDQSNNRNLHGPIG